MNKSMNHLLLTGIALLAAATAAAQSPADADTVYVGRDVTVPVALFDLSQARNTASVSSVDGATVGKNTAVNFTNSLAGYLPGLTLFQSSGEPGNDTANWLIRGIGSYGSASFNSAKIFVDGFEVNASYIAHLSPAEIERVSVLKDGAALALYGERGANGIILIETKRGKAGAFEVDANVHFGVQQPTVLAKPLNSYEYATLYNQAVSNDAGRWAPAYSDAQIEAYRTGAGTNVDWYDEVLRKTGRTVDGDITFRGGSQVARYNVMLDYLNQQGLYNVNNSDSKSNRSYQRYGLRANLDFTLFKFIDARVDLGGRLERAKRPNISTDDMFYNLARYPQNIYEIWDDDAHTQWSGTNVYNSNPVASLNALGWRQTQSRILQGNFELVEKLDFITKGLYLREAFSFNTLTQSGYSKTRNYARYHNGVRTTTDEDTSLTASGYGSDGMEDWKQGRITLGYDGVFSGRHFLTAAVDFHLSAYNGDGYFSYKYRYANLNGRVNYSYDNRYVAELGFSYFGNDSYAPGHRWAFYPSVSAAWVISNEKFLKDSRAVDLLKLRLSYGRSGFSDSSATSAISFDSNGRYLYKNYYTNSYVGSFWTGANEGTWQSSLVNMFLSNRLAHAEKSDKFNAGIDMSLFGKLSLTADAFLEKRTDILTLDTSMMEYYGKNYYFDNIGKMTNRGFEISAVWNDQRGDWGYNIFGSVSFNRNTVDYMAEVTPAYGYNAQTGRPFGTLIGLVADGFYDVDDFKADGSLRDGLPQPMFGNVQPGDIKYLDLDNSGYVDQNDVTKIGKSPFPEWTYTFGAQFNWRGFDLGFMLQGVAGASFNLLDNAVQTMAFVDNGNAYPIAQGAWAYYPQQGIDTRHTATYPRLTTESNENNYRLSSFWVKDRSFMRVRNIELGYSFRNNARFRAAGIGQFRIYLNVTNPFTASRLMSDYGLDPELLSYRYPVLKTYNVGVNLTF